MAHKYGPPCLSGMSTATTPRAAGMIDLLGRHAHRSGVSLCRDEWRAVERLYGVTCADPNRLITQGNARNLLRQAESDGLRILAWLARYVPPGTDPLVAVVQAVAAAGGDVPPEDVAWAEGDADADAEEDAA